MEHGTPCGVLCCGLSGVSRFAGSGCERTETLKEEEAMSSDGKKEKPNRFLLRCREKSDYNQYWYSANTIRTLVEECEREGKRVACLSTPSVFFSMGETFRKNGAVLDFDEKFAKKGGESFAKFDYNKPEEIPERFHNKFDFVVIDPPFITREVWEKYATATKRVLAKGGKILLTTIDENEKMIFELLGCRRQVFRPSIPNLVYQYSVYANYDSRPLSIPNPEIPVAPDE